MGHINCKGKLISLDTPKVMAILNLTGDSFFDGGKYLGLSENDLLQQVEHMLTAGADFIDIGGMSSRPGAEIINKEDELARVLPAVKAIAKHFPNCIMSIDTLHASVAEVSVSEGAAIINDISAGMHDSDMLSVVAGLKCPYILMHMQGLPNTMQQNPEYVDVVKDVIQFFANRLEACRQLGISDIILDPGFGFGKTVQHNYTLLKNLNTIKHITGHHILAGISRKSMICKVLQVNPANALNGSTAAHMLALHNGASILRVHDVKEAVEAIKIFETYSKA